MGFPMARNMARAGIDVRAWNRTRAKARPLAGEGVTVCGSPAEAAAGAGVIVTMLSDADSVIATIGKALDGIERDAMWLQMSTIGEAGTDRCIELARDHDVGFLDAPVLGTRQPADQGELVVLASGPEPLRKRVQPVLDAVGQKTMWVGEAGAGTRLKVVTNSWVVTVVEGCAETIALAQGIGVEPKLLFEALEGGALDLPYLQMKGKAILERDFRPMFRLKLATKDAGLVEESAERHGLDLPLFNLIRERLSQAMPEHGDEDIIATYLTSAPAGVAA
jgi:3-hydroxyisobutyrate dehydrogenase